MAEAIDPNPQDTSAWTPSVGRETNDLLLSKGFSNPNGTLNDSGSRVLDETYRIMQICGNPHDASNNETGIVIGYVQSGKTLSFTTLTAIARDNNYQVVIVIAGTSSPLVNQSTKRLEADLRLNDRFDHQWTLMSNPSQGEHRETIENALSQWANPTFPKNRCKTVLITVMKQKNHLQNLAGLFRGLSLKNVPTLIIDDEGDQASLDTGARRAAWRGINFQDIHESDRSRIYRSIISLKDIFPHHTFIQYTATPQANLFINILDRLSPNFIKLLTPGSDYTGGVEFFINHTNLIKEISLTDLGIINQGTDGPPNSLLEALRFFYLGVVAGNAQESYRQPGQRNRSMLVHPSRLQGDHSQFTGWVRNISSSWHNLLSGDDEDEKAILLNDFRLTYNILSMTVADLPDFENLTDINLIHAIQYTPIVEVNARNGVTPQIKWNESYSWILVGGQSMDRGFTVEGLTVTYMPRNVGVGNVDTIQQRARFFGYKKSYLGYCRVFLDQVTIDAYTFIVEHEEDVRSRLEEFHINNKHLDDWNREAVLDQMLRLTRANILFDNLDRDRFGNEWFRIKAPHDTEEYIETNRHSIMSYVAPQSDLFNEDEGSPRRTSEQRHLVATVKLKDCLDQLLNKLKFTRESDSASYSSLRGIVKRYLEDNPDEECVIYLMSTQSLDSWRARTRSLDRKDEIQQLFQGRNPRTGNIIYPGDSYIKENKILTIQVHMLDLKSAEGDYDNVPTVAIWIPDYMGKDIIRKQA
jgi:hypothetical protein